MNKTILILGARLNQLAAIQTAKRMGLRVIAADPDPKAIGLELADHAAVCDLADFGACLQVARQHQIDGVLTIAADYPVPAVASICDQLGLAGITPEVARKATNKREMRQSLRAANVACPQSFHVTDVEQAWDIIGRLAGPAIVKPALSNGSQGITRLPAGVSRGDLGQAFEHALRTTRADGVLIEQFIDGPEFSVEAVTVDGRTEVIAVTDKITSESHCVEIGHSQPSQWPELDLAAIAATATAAVSALGINHSASHSEIRLGPNGPVIIETAARLGGGFINSHLVPLTTGVDIVAAAIQIALGEQPSVEPTRVGGAAIRFLTPTPGIVRRITGVDQCRQAAGVVEAVVTVDVGDRVAALRDNSARAGHVICQAADAATAIELAQQAAQSISIETTPELAALVSETIA